MLAHISQICIQKQMFEIWFIRLRKMLYWIIELLSYTLAEEVWWNVWCILTMSRSIFILWSFVIFHIYVETKIQKCFDRYYNVFLAIFIYSRMHVMHEFNKSIIYLITKSEGGKLYEKIDIDRHSYNTRNRKKGKNLYCIFFAFVWKLRPLMVAFSIPKKV